MSTTWADGPLAAFDLETTGVDPESARIVTASVVVIEGGTPRVREWLADPGIDIPDSASAIHGVTTAHARAHGTPAAEVVGEIDSCLSVLWEREIPVVIYNAAYDLTLLDRELRRHCNVSLTPGLVIDPLVLDRATDPYRKGKRTLETVAALHRVPLSKDDAHTSTGDCLAAARVVWCQAHRVPAVGSLSLDELQVWQRGAHVDWADSFEAYLRTQGRGDVIDRSWPIRPYVAQAGAVA